MLTGIIGDSKAEKSVTRKLEAKLFPVSPVRWRSNGLAKREICTPLHNAALDLHSKPVVTL